MWNKMQMNKQHKEKIKQVEVGGKCNMNFSRETCESITRINKVSMQKMCCILKNNKENMQEKKKKFERRRCTSK